ncbi:centromere protein W isoform X1 [Apteryx rowi]|nr:centromere protein W isoform X1 [Apteryx rowi]
MMKRTAPRSTLRKIIKKHKPQLRLAANADLLVHLNFLLFLHRLAEEARTNAFESKSKIIKPEHAIAAAKVSCKNSVSLICGVICSTTLVLLDKWNNKTEYLGPLASVYLLVFFFW